MSSEVQSARGAMPARLNMDAPHDDARVRMFNRVGNAPRVSSKALAALPPKVR